MTAATISYAHNWNINRILTGLSAVERSIAKSLSLTLFSANLWLGRWLFAVTFIASPRIALAGAVGVIANYIISKFISRNESLKESGIFCLNGLFLGLGCGSFLPDNTICLIAILLLAFICCIFVIVFDRILRVWDLPQLILPALFSTWTLQILSWLNPALNLAERSVVHPWDSPILNSMVFAGFKGYGQIFFQNNLLLSAAIFLILARFKVLPLRLLMILPIAATIPPFFLAGSHWAVTSGLTSFGAILLLSAKESKFLTIASFHLVLLVLLSGIIELISIQLFGIAHLFALSSGYILLMWLAKLLGETAKAPPKTSATTMPW